MKGEIVVSLALAVFLGGACTTWKNANPYSLEYSREFQKKFDQKVANCLEASVTHDGRIRVILPEKHLQYHSYLTSCLFLENKPWKELAKRIESGWDKKETRYEAVFHSKNTSNPPSFEFIGPKDKLSPDERDPWFKPAEEIEYSFRHPFSVTSGTLKVDTTGW